MNNYICVWNQSMLSGEVAAHSMILSNRNIKTGLETGKCLYCGGSIYWRDKKGKLHPLKQEIQKLKETVKKTTSNY